MPLPPLPRSAGSAPATPLRASHAWGSDLPAAAASSSSSPRPPAAATLQRLMRGLPPPVALPQPGDEVAPLDEHDDYAYLDTQQQPAAEDIMPWTKIQVARAAM